MTPGSALPVAGQLLAVYRWPYQSLERWRARYGPRFVVRVPDMPPLVFLADRDDADAVYGAPVDVLRPGEGGRTIEPIVGPRAFVLADGDEHLRGRMLLRETFRRTTAERHAELLRDLAAREVARWPVDRQLRLYPRLRTFALDAILRTVFGETPRLPALTERFIRLLEAASSPVLGAPPTRRLPGLRAVWRSFLRDRDELDALLFGLIDERRRAGGGDGASDTLGLLVDAVDDSGRPLSREYIRDSVMSVVLAGHETVASTLAWTFALLAHHPDVQARVAADPDPDGPTSITTATLSEVMRHRSVFIFSVPRAVAAPFELAGETFEPGPLLLPCIHLIHHDPRHYPQPDEFLPERFMTQPADRTIWLPWGGAGRRRCPGRHLAMIELRTIVRLALQAYRVEPTSAAPEPPGWRSVIVTPRRGARVVLRRR